MEYLIPSNYYRKFCEENKIVFSDREYAALLRSCSWIPLYQTLDELKKIAEKTEDTELKAEIGEIIAHYNKQIEIFKDNSDKSCIYVVEHGNGFFTRFEEAYENAAATFKCFSCLDHFSIEKRLLVDAPLRTEPRSEYDVEFDENGNMIRLIGGALFKGKITDKKISIENPFRRGDFVMNCRSREIGVVETNHENWAETSMYFLKKDKGITIENPCIRVTVISQYGGLRTTTWEPFILEKVDDFDIEGKDADMLRFISAFLRGENYNDSFGFITVGNLVSMIKTENSDPDLDHRVFADGKRKSSTSGFRVTEEDMQSINRRKENKICRFYVFNEEAKKIPDMDRIHSFKQLTVLKIYNALSFDGIRAIYIFGTSTKDYCEKKDSLDIAFDMTVSRDEKPQLYDDLCGIVSKCTDGKCNIIFLNENTGDDDSLKEKILNGAKIYESGDRSSS